MSKLILSMIVACLASVLFVGQASAHEVYSYYQDGSCDSEYGFEYVCGATDSSVAGSGEVIASYYGYELAGSLTASGEPFEPLGLTAAHKTLPLGTIVTVCYEECVTVRVNDRGPFVAGRDLDLSLGAAQAIGFDSVGVGAISVSY